MFLYCPPHSPVTCRRFHKQYVICICKFVTLHNFTNQSPWTSILYTIVTIFSLHSPVIREKIQQCWHFKLIKITPLFIFILSPIHRGNWQRCQKRSGWASLRLAMPGINAREIPAMKNSLLSQTVSFPNTCRLERTTPLLIRCKGSVYKHTFTYCRHQHQNIHDVVSA